MLLITPNTGVAIMGVLPSIRLGYYVLVKLNRAPLIGTWQICPDNWI
jgi:hypothetical protein